MKRERTDYYYARSLTDDWSINGDGTYSFINEETSEGRITVKGRREDRPKVLKRPIKTLARAATYATLRELVIAEKSKQPPEVFNPYDDMNWTLDDMPDNVLARYESWTDNLPEISETDILDAANSVLRANEIAGDTEETILLCRWCEARDGHACRKCGYARGYQKYPIVRFTDGTNHKDEVFDVAKYLLQNPDAISYEIARKFSYKGVMSATQYAVLNMGTADGVEIDKADAIADGVRIPLTSWRESDDAPIIDKAFSDGRDLALIINELQTQIAQMELELVNNRESQQDFDRITRGFRTIGKGTLDVVSRLRYEGMGESGNTMSAGTLPYVETRDKVLGRDYDYSWLVRDVAKRIDENNGRIDLRFEGGY